MQDAVRRSSGLRFTVGVSVEHKYSGIKYDPHALELCDDWSVGVPPCTSSQSSLDVRDCQLCVNATSRVKANECRFCNQGFVLKDGVCSAAPCPPYAQISMSSSQYSCSCLTGYASPGIAWNSSVSRWEGECLPSCSATCLSNNGTCAGPGVCLCPEGKTGEECETPCHSECLGGCRGTGKEGVDEELLFVGPSAFNCTSCQNVQQLGECVRECHGGRFPDSSGECLCPKGYPWVNQTCQGGGICECWGEGCKHRNWCSSFQSSGFNGTLWESAMNGTGCLFGSGVHFNETRLINITKSDFIRYAESNDTMNTTVTFPFNYTVTHQNISLLTSNSTIQQCGHACQNACTLRFGSEKTCNEQWACRWNGTVLGSR